MSTGPRPGRPAVRAARRGTPSLLAGAAQGALVAAVSAVAVVLVVVAQNAVARARVSGLGPDADLVVLTVVVVAVGAAAVGAVIGALAALVVRRSGLGDPRARAVVTVFPVLVVAGVVAAITQGTRYSTWLWAMVPVSAVAALVLARRLVPRG